MATSQNFWRAWLLGAVHGFVVGLFGSATSVIIFEHENTQTLDSILNQTYLTEPPNVVPPAALAWLAMLIIVSCCFCFALSSYLVHRVLWCRISSVYLLWQIIGLVAAVFWCGLVAAIDGTSYRHGRGSILKYDTPITRELLITIAVVFIVLALLNFVFSFVLHLALSQYAHRKAIDANGAVAGAV